VFRQSCIRLAGVIGAGVIGAGVLQGARRRHMLTLGLAILLSAFSSHQPALATQWFVNPGGTGQFPTIQAALSSPSVVDGDVILLADGIYGGAGNYNIDFLGKDVTVRGGNINDPDNVTILCGGSPGSPRRGFIFNNGETANAVLMALSVQEGYVEGEDGGGIWIGAASPTIDYVHVRWSQARDGNGGGIACLGPGSPTILRTGIFDNVAGGDAGGLGGGIYAVGSAATQITLTSAWRNQAVTTNFGIGGHGGGIYCEGGILSDVTVAQNMAYGSGGGLYTIGATVSNTNSFENEALVEGGGAYASAATLAGCWISANRSPIAGGIKLSQASMIGCGVTGNVALGGPGGGVDGSSGSLLQNCTVSGNRSSTGGGFSGSDTFLERTIIWGNCATGPGAEISAGPGVVLVCCCSSLAGISGNVAIQGPLAEGSPRYCGTFDCWQAPVAFGNYFLDPLSSCLPAGNSCGQLIGALGQGCGVTTDVVEQDAGWNEEDDLRVSSPVRGAAEVTFRLMEPARARVSVMDASGRMVARVLNADLGDGQHQVIWSGRDEHGVPSPPGVYFVRLEAGRLAAARKVILLGDSR